jgi:RimJ/RimL family protein N-acetyltransferase
MGGRENESNMSQTTYPKIRKASIVRGETLVFRNACVSDAEFILSLRTDENKSRFLSATSNDLEAQKTWLIQYAAAEGQAYFIIEFNDAPIGTVRLYDAPQNSFCWGSWILKDGRPRQAAMESALMVYSYALDNLGFSNSHFEVRKGNERVWQFHERFGAFRVSETGDSYYYSLPLDAICNSLARYKKFLPNAVLADFL